MNIQEKKKAFITILDDLDRSKHRQDNFRNFCDMAYCAIAKRTALDEEAAENFEARYMEIVGTYSDKDDVRKMPELMSLTTLALHEKGCDFLGEIAGEIGALDKRNCQFFTPYHISRLMAEVSLEGATTTINEQGFISVSDPAAGAGCMILASADYLEDQGHDILYSMSAQVTELSRMTYHMLYIQLALRGIPASVIHGNSLSLEVFESAYTPSAMIFAQKHGYLFKDAPQEEKQKPPNSDFIVGCVKNCSRINHQ